MSRKRSSTSSGTTSRTRPRELVEAGAPREEALKYALKRPRRLRWGCRRPLRSPTAEGSWYHTALAVLPPHPALPDVSRSISGGPPRLGHTHADPCRRHECIWLENGPAKVDLPLAGLLSDGPRGLMGPGPECGRVWGMGRRGPHGSLAAQHNPSMLPPSSTSRYPLWMVIRFRFPRWARPDWIMGVLYPCCRFPFLAFWLLYFYNGGGEVSLCADSRFSTWTTSAAVVFLLVALTTAIFYRIGPPARKGGRCSLSPHRLWSYWPG